LSRQLSEEGIGCGRTSLKKREEESSCDGRQEEGARRHQSSPNWESTTNARRRVLSKSDGCSDKTIDVALKSLSAFPHLPSHSDASPYFHHIHTRRILPPTIKSTASLLSPSHCITSINMAAVSLLNVAVRNNPAPFTSPYEFEITFECLEKLDKDLEWKLTYVGSATS
jgi:hypothetical protein